MNEHGLSLRAVGLGLVCFCVRLEVAASRRQKCDLEVCRSRSQSRWLVSIIQNPEQAVCPQRGGTECVPSWMADGRQWAPCLAQRTPWMPICSLQIFEKSPHIQTNSQSFALIYCCQALIIYTYWKGFFFFIIVLHVWVHRYWDSLLHIPILPFSAPLLFSPTLFR